MLKDEIKPIIETYEHLAGSGGSSHISDSTFDYNRNYYNATSGLLEHNRIIFDIYEGDLLTYVLADLERQFSKESFKQVKARVAPINVLKRLVDKLSKIYLKPPVRKVIGGAEKDQMIYDWYAEEMSLNVNMAIGNEFFNLFKNCALEPYLDNGAPRIRTLPSDRFFVYSTDRTNPLRPTHFAKIMGKAQLDDGPAKTVLYVYTKDEFIIVDEKGQPLRSMMEEVGNPEGVNPYGVLPFVYINRSKHDLIPTIDSDTLAMTKLFPILLSDLNYAVMYQAFSIMYGIDLDNENLKLSPNAFWNFKSDTERETKPQVGVIKPEVDTDKVLNLIKTQLTFWLQSKSVKPGAIGNIDVENMASGISKAIDEMDTSEDRQKQIPYFQQAEKELFTVIQAMHPVWMRDPNFQNRIAFSPALTLQVTFPEQKPLVDPSKLVDDVIKKIGSKLQSRKGAMKELYPEWSEDEIEQKLEEIDAETTVEMEEMTSGAMQGDTSQDDAQGNDGENDKEKEEDEEAAV